VKKENLKSKIKNDVSLNYPRELSCGLLNMFKLRLSIDERTEICKERKCRLSLPRPPKGQKCTTACKGVQYD